MIKKFISTTTFALVAIAMSAAPISRNQALKRATESLVQQGVSIEASTMTMAAKAPARGVSQTSAYYIFNGNNSFVIAAGDDQLPPVLGYSDCGIIDTDNMPDGLKELLEMYAYEASTVSSVSTAYSPMPKESISLPAIAPLVTCHWNQGAPYNTLCPPNSEGGTSVTGCVATALAQILYCHKWPNVLQHDIPGYVTRTTGTTMPALPASGWPGFSNMRDTYVASDTDAGAADVAALMLYCGQALEMNYNTSSGANTSNIVKVLRHDFDYFNGVRLMERNSYNNDDWTILLYKELSEGRPMVFRGNPLNRVGHAFVCDGYKGDGLFHINWGWGGSSDGYYYCNRLIPGIQGAGSSSGGGGYCYDLEAIVGITPSNKPFSYEVAGRMCVNNLNLVSEPHITRNSVDGSFPDIVVNAKLLNETVNGDFYMGFGLYDSIGNLVSTLYSYRCRDFKSGTYFAQNYTLKMPADIAPGDYTIEAMSHLTGDDQWIVMSNSVSNHINAHITDTTAHFTLISRYGTPDYKVNSVTYDGVFKEGQKIDMKINLTNSGNTPFSHIFLFIDGKATTMAQCPINIGETGDIFMSFSVSTPGNHQMALALENNGNNMIWTGQLNLAQPSDANIAFDTPVIHNVSARKYIGGTSFAGSVTARNVGGDYQNYINIQLFRRTSSSGIMLVDSHDQLVCLAAGESLTMDFEFTGLQDGEEYYVSFSYCKGNTPVCGKTSDRYTIVEKFDPNDVNHDTVIDVRDMNIILSALLGLDTSFGDEQADVNGDGIIDILDLNSISNYILKK